MMDEEKDQEQRTTIEDLNKTISEQRTEIYKLKESIKAIRRRILRTQDTLISLKEGEIERLREKQQRNWKRSKWK